MGASLKSFPRRGVVLGYAGVAAALLLAVGITGFLMSVRPVPMSSQPPVSPTATSSQPSVSPTPVRPSFPTVDQLPPDYETPGADPSGAWTKVTFSQVTAEQVTPLDTSPVRWSGGWVGSFAMGDSEWLAWISADGRTWHATSAPGEALPAPTGLVTYDDKGYVWTSVDGRVWSRHPLTGLDPTAVSEQIGGSGGLLASVGSEPGAVPWELSFSQDGLTWQLVSLPVDSGGVRILDIAWTGSRFLAVGTTPTSATADKLVVFWSSDGLSWNKSAIEGPAGVTLRNEVAVQTARGGAIIEAADGSGEFRRLWSADGSTWQPMPSSGPLVGLEARLYSNGERFLARSTTDGQMWSSFDGQTWTALQGKAPFPSAWSDDVDYDMGDLLEVLPRGIVYGNMDMIQYGTAE